MSSTLTPRHGSWAPWVIQDFLVFSLPSNLSSSTISLAVIYFLPQDACNAQSLTPGQPDPPRDSGLVPAVAIPERRLQPHLLPNRQSPHDCEQDREPGEDCRA